MPVLVGSATEVAGLLISMRTQLGMSQRQLADKLMVSQATINRWEHEQPSTPVVAVTSEGWAFWNSRAGRWMFIANAETDVFGVGTPP